ncbi:MAG: FtsQ-type POTRA domain-containing protein, partial [Patescibacteria group bacterium]
MKRYSQPIQYDNPYFQKPAKNWWMQHDRWAYGVTSLLIVGCVGYFAINQQWCWINNITVTGNEYLSTEQITQPAWQALNTRRWWLLPQRFYFFSNTNYIAEHIKQTLSNNFGLDTVIVTKQFPKQINIVVSERIPGLTYIINNDYYYLDQASYITEKVSNISEINQKYPHLRDLNTTRTVTVGNSVVGEQTMNFLVQLNKNFTKVSQLNI